MHALVLVLVGLQGSGKSFFTARLREKLRGSNANSKVTFIGINQDTIRRDFPLGTSTTSKKLSGTREDCLTVLRNAFDKPNPGMDLVAVIDRTNLTIEQRSTWIKEVQLQREKGHDVLLFCVFLDVPVKTASFRAAQRQDHEGNVHGQKAYAIVHRCNATLQRPNPKSEQFDKIFTVCSNDQVDCVVKIIHDSVGRGNYDRLKRFNLDAEDESPIPEKKPKRDGAGVVNAFEVLMKSQQNQAHKTTNKAFPPGGQNKWQGALVWYAKTEFDKDSSLVEYSDDQCVIIRDKYPKARIHCLCIARDLSLQEPLDINPTHKKLLQHMKQASLNVLHRIVGGNVNKDAFQMGFHAVPSMRQLHLHIISKDFDSPCLKTRKHWVSFTNKDFFLDIDDFIEVPLQYEIEEKKKILKSAPLTCPRCLQSGFKSVNVVLDHYRNSCFPGSLKTP